MTLLELLIAMAVFAILSALAYGGLNSVLNTAAQTRTQAERLGELQLAFSIVQRDLVQVVDRPIRDEYGDGQPALRHGHGLTLLEFTKGGWRNPTGQARSSLERVAYRLDDRDWIRQSWPHLDRAPNTPSFSAVLLTEVDDLRLRFLDHQLNWQDTWPPPNAAEAPALPRAIEVTVTLAGWDEITRLFALID